jgi:hypothetical protein
MVKAGAFAACTVGLFSQQQMKKKISVLRVRNRAKLSISEPEARPFAISENEGR